MSTPNSTTTTDTEARIRAARAKIDHPDFEAETRRLPQCPGAVSAVASWGLTTEAAEAVVLSAARGAVLLAAESDPGVPLAELLLAEAGRR